MLTTTVFLEHLNKLYSCMVVSVGWLKPKHGIQKKREKFPPRFSMAWFALKANNRAKEQIGVQNTENIPVLHLRVF